MKQGWLHLLLVAHLVALPGIPNLAGQESTDEQPYQSPVIRFEPDGLGVVEAVRLTLQHSPNIKLQEADTFFQQGVAQTQTGAFDLGLRGNLSYEWREQELPESTKDAEREKRADLESAVNAGEANRGPAEELRDTLVRVRNDNAKPESIPDPEIQARVVLLDTLIASIEDPDARKRLRELRQSYLGAQIDEAKAMVDSLLGELDAMKDELAKLGPSPDEQIIQKGIVGVELSKLLRNGIVLTPFFDGRVDSLEYKGKPTSEEFGGLGKEDLYEFRVGFEVVLPLARGRGSDATGAAERAALLDHEASLSALRFQSSLSVLDTSIAYWALRAAQDNLDALQTSVDRQERLVDLTQAQIDVGEIPAVEISRVRASAARSRARLEDARRSLYEARVDLALVMGISATDDPATLPTAGDPFPDVPDPFVLEGEEVVSLAQDALDLRQDLQAAITVQEADGVVRRGAETDLRPRLDVVAGTWYTAIGETTVNNAVDRWVGPSFSGALEFDKPFGNNFFKGLLAQSQATLNQSQIGVVDLERTIQLSVGRLAATLLDAAESVRQAQDSYDFYLETINAEVQRFQAGDATLVDTILTEDQQVGSLVSLIAAKQAFASLLAELRFETGLLVTHRNGQSEVTEEQLVTVPRRGSR